LQNKSLPHQKILSPSPLSPSQKKRPGEDLELVQNRLIGDTQAKIKDLDEEIKILREKVFSKKLVVALIKMNGKQKIVEEGGPRYWISNQIKKEEK